MRKIVLFSFFAVLILSGCSKYADVRCGEPSFGWHLHGYDTSQLGVFIMNKYEKGTHFATQLSHTVSGTAFHRDSVYGPDTVAYEVNFYAHPFPDYFGDHIDARYDYEFIFPLAGRSFYLRDIVSQPSTMRFEKEDHAACERAFQYYLNDTLYQYPAHQSPNKATIPTIITFHL